ncbi:MAG TPA: hypothetical protein VGY58_17760, partial [Gemmataceae bacterium]|nr:hypothetical protein [Gemmataceae bacterium]
LLGAGLGLLLADRLSAEQRKAVGCALFLIGALSSIPLAFEVLGGSRRSGGHPEQGEFAPLSEDDERTAGAGDDARVNPQPY